MHHSRGLCSHMESHPHSLPWPTVPCVIWPLAVSTACLSPHSSPASLLFLKHPKLILTQGLWKGSSRDLKFPSIIFWSLLKSLALWRDFADSSLPAHPPLVHFAYPYCTHHSLELFCVFFNIFICFFIKLFSFSFPVFPDWLRYNWHVAQYKFKVYSIMIWLACTMKWLSQ